MSKSLGCWATAAAEASCNCCRKPLLFQRLARKFGLGRSGRARTVPRNCLERNGGGGGWSRARAGAVGEKAGLAEEEGLIFSGGFVSPLRATREREAASPSLDPPSPFLHLHASSGVTRLAIGNGPWGPGFALRRVGRVWARCRVAIPRAIAARHGGFRVEGVRSGPIYRGFRGKSAWRRSAVRSGSGALGIRGLKKSSQPCRNACLRTAEHPSTTRAPVRSLPARHSLHRAPFRCLADRHSPRLLPCTPNELALLGDHEAHAAC